MRMRIGRHAKVTCSWVPRPKGFRRRGPIRPALTRPDHEADFAQQLAFLKLTGFEREYRFAPPRRWRIDFAHVELKLAVEIEGAIYAEGRHTRGAGFEKDCEKYNRLVELGWQLIRLTPRMVKDGSGVQTVERIVKRAHGESL